MLAVSLGAGEVLAGAEGLKIAEKSPATTAMPNHIPKAIFKNFTAHSPVCRLAA